MVLVPTVESTFIGNRNYSIMELECLVIELVLESISYYLLGRKFNLSGEGNSNKL